jgi:bifunctional non-homologous end joining protein LigD
MQRYPEGIETGGFFHKDAPDYFPAWIERKEIKKKENGLTHYVICNDTATLVYLTNYDMITPHIWLSTIDKLDYPDRMIFDLDPPRDDFSRVQAGAELLKNIFDAMEITTFVMTTGSKGAHVIIPLDQTASFDITRECSQQIAQKLAQDNPDMLTTEIRKSKRGDRLFIDTGRNAYAQTGVAPYAIRARMGGPIATPLRWDELLRPDMTSQAYTIKTIFRRLSHIDHDPWHDIHTYQYAIDTIQKRWKEIENEPFTMEKNI